MINALELGKLLVEDIQNEPGPCLYPGKFHPPHKGHFEAAKNLAARDYITQVLVILSSKVSPETGNITPEDALAIWKLYLAAQPNSKIKVRISEHGSPVVDMIKYIEEYPEAKAIYIAGGEDERDDKEYLNSLSQKFPGRVKPITVNEKAGGVSAPAIRELIQQGDYESFKDTIPVAAFNKGAAPKIWKILTSAKPNDKG